IRKYIVVAQHHPLGSAGGAGGVYDGGELMLIAACILHSLGFSPRIVQWPVWQPVMQGKHETIVFFSRTSLNRNDAQQMRNLTPYFMKRLPLGQFFEQ